MKQTYKCNRDFMRELRLSNGWTQAELAKRAGYSERLIGKAESEKSKISGHVVSEGCETGNLCGQSL